VLDVVKSTRRDAGILRLRKADGAKVSEAPAKAWAAIVSAAGGVLFIARFERAVTQATRARAD
jgi:hypothetical protein